MQQTYNFLIIGRCGSGKSSTVHQLTGCEETRGWNSLHTVTKQVKYYRSNAERQHRCKVSFGVLDIPGLDEVACRKVIRQRILHELESRALDLDGILYTLDCVSRDVIDSSKIFNFLNELPWSLQDTRQCLIPILTKYDNLVFDADDENTKTTLEQFTQLFEKNHYGESWRHNHLYWVNTTKNIDRKMSICNDIKQVYETQFDKLLYLMQKKKTRLTRQKIQQFLRAQQAYTLMRIKEMIIGNEIIMRAASCTITQQLTLEINPRHNQNYTAMTLGSAGVLLTRVIRSHIGKAVLAVGTVLLAGGIIVHNLMQEEAKIMDRGQEKQEIRLRLENTYVIEQMEEEMKRDLAEYAKQLRLQAQGSVLYVNVPQKHQAGILTINRQALSECYLDEVPLGRDQQGNFYYRFLEDEQPETIVATLKLRFTVLIPQEQALLLQLQKESNGFKRQFDVLR